MSSAVSERAHTLWRPAACPHLPEAPEDLDWRYLNAVREDRNGRFYLCALTYGQFLWRQGLAARALLSVDRALGAQLAGDEPELQRWPLPYPAIAWILRETPPQVFLGNPRVHFQHLADRVGEPRRQQRSARYWACWHLARRILPQLPGDPKHRVREPTFTETYDSLRLHGLPGEADHWNTLAASLAPAACPEATADAIRSGT
jgi:hypothetical protein